MEVFGQIIWIKSQIIISKNHQIDILSKISYLIDAQF